MITEDYVSLETAKLLKKKGFLKTVDLRMTQNLSFYDKIGLSHNLNKYYDRLIQEKIDFVVAPTLQMAMKWLREKHKIHIEVEVYYCKNGQMWLAKIQRIESANTVLVKTCMVNNTYEEAIETAIKYCLENLI